MKLEYAKSDARKLCSGSYNCERSKKGKNHILPAAVLVPLFGMSWAPAVKPSSERNGYLLSPFSFYSVAAINFTALAVIPKTPYTSPTGGTSKWKGMVEQKEWIRCN